MNRGGRWGLWLRRAITGVPATPVGLSSVEARTEPMSPHHIGNIRGMVSAGAPSKKVRDRVIELRKIITYHN